MLKCIWVYTTIVKSCALVHKILWSLPMGATFYNPLKISLILCIFLQPSITLYNLKNSHCMIFCTSLHSFATCDNRAQRCTMF